MGGGGEGGARGGGEGGGEGGGGEGGGGAVGGAGHAAIWVATPANSRLRPAPTLLTEKVTCARRRGRRGGALVT